MEALLRLASRGRVSPRRATYFLLLRQKKVGKEKATLLSVSLRFATGNLRCSAQEGVRRTRFAQTAAALIPPAPALLGTARRELEPEQAIAALGLGGGPSLCSAGALVWTVTAEGSPTSATPHTRTTPSASMASTPNANHGRREAPAVAWRPSEAMARPVSHPLWLRRGAERFADQGSQLFERSEFCETPRNASTAGCPQRSGGSQTVGSPFFCLRFFGEAKKSRSAAGPRPGLGKQPLSTTQKGASQ
ncbi:UNVERIFIED_ORG: hypothetical protein J2W38_003605 [Variovorax paradoxus]|nr:hypothetical protein [Variovorax paradoxus]